MAVRNRSVPLPWISCAFGVGAIFLQVVESFVPADSRLFGIAPDAYRIHLVFMLLQAVTASVIWRFGVLTQVGCMVKPSCLARTIATIAIGTMALATTVTLDLGLEEAPIVSGRLLKVLVPPVLSAVACGSLSALLLWLLQAGGAMIRIEPDVRRSGQNRLLVAGAAGAMAYVGLLVVLLASGYNTSRTQIDLLRRMEGVVNSERFLVQKILSIDLRDSGARADALRASADEIARSSILWDALVSEAEGLSVDAGGLRADLRSIEVAHESVARSSQSMVAGADVPRARRSGLLRAQLHDDAAQAVDAAAASIEHMERAVRRYCSEVSEEMALAGTSILAFTFSLMFGIATPVSTMLQRLALVARHTHHPVFICDPDLRVVWSNMAFGRVTGFTSDESVGRRLEDLHQFAQADPLTSSRLHTAVDSGDGIRVEILCASRAGVRQWLDLDIRPVHDAYGDLCGFIGVEIDITPRVHLANYLKAVLDTTGAGILVQDSTGSIIDCNVEAERLFCRPREELIGDSFHSGKWTFLRSNGDMLAAFETPPVKCLRLGKAVRDAVLGVVLDNGSECWVQANAQIMVENGAMVVVSSFADITARKQLERRLQVEARTDKLTGLANRAMFTEWLEGTIRHRDADSAATFAVLLLDFDRFKLINDSLGHDAGDLLLCEIATRLRKALRGGERGHGRDRIARFGGDEFVALLTEARSISDAIGVADRILGQMSAPYEIKGTVVDCSVSVGVFMSDANSITADSALQCADAAMYEAKRSGGGTRVVFEPRMQVEVARTLSIETALRKSIAGDELYLVYQPIIDLQTGKMTAVEALLRWRSRALGEVAPGEFIPIAEQSGLIVPLGERVLREACMQMAEWQRLNPELAPSLVSVNVSRIQMNGPDRLRAVVKEALGAAALAPGALQVELTEREIMKDLDSVRTLMAELRQLGVKLAMDDFGTGASSLGCLCDLKFDVVKIDRSFIAGLDARPDLLAVARATVMMLRDLGLASVAEGVETAEQLAVLKAIRCQYGQGYFFGRPMAAGTILSATASHA